MAKISELPLVNAPTGTETVVVLSEGEAHRVPLGPLAAAALETAVAVTVPPAAAAAVKGEIDARLPSLDQRVTAAGDAQVAAENARNAAVLAVTDADTSRQAAVAARLEAETARAGAEAAAIAARVVADTIGIEPIRGGWENIVKDLDGRILRGWNLRRGMVDSEVDPLKATVTALAPLPERVAVLEAALPVPDITTTAPRIGRWSTLLVDLDGRILDGDHEVRGRVLPPESSIVLAQRIGTSEGAIGTLDGRMKAIEEGGTDPLPAARRAVRLAGLKELRFGDLMPVMAFAEQPMVSRLTYADADTNTQSVISRADTRLTYGHARPTQKTGAFPAETLYVGAQVTHPDARPYSPSWGVRMQTDSPAVELVTSYGTRITVLVDGKRLGPGHTVATGSDFQTTRLDFGTDVLTIRPRWQVPVSGGGYAVGDRITPDGGTGTPMTLVVVAVGAGGAVSSLRVLDWGTYTALPAAGTSTTTTGLGTGATVTLTDDKDSVRTTGHTTRRMRRIQFILSDTSGNTNGSAVHSLRVVKYSTVRPWPFAGVRMVTLQDSYGQVFTDRPDGVWAWRTAERLGIEDVWTNAIGGTGFLSGTSSGGSALNMAYRTRVPDLVAAAPTDGRPYLVVVQGSINDSNAPSAAALQAEVEAVWRLIFAQLPDAFLVQTGILRAPGNNTDTAKADAVRLGFLAAQAAYDPAGKRSGFIDTRNTREVLSVGGRAGALTGTGNTDWWISGDAAHLTQSGHDYVGDVFAADLLGLFQTFSI